LLLILAVALVGGVLLWRSRFGGNGQESGQFETIPVGRGIIRATIATSGTAEAMDETELRFATIGRVNKILVVLGQEVKSGDPLAALESDDLEDHLSSAEANLATAHIRLRQLLKGADEADLLAADQTIATAQAAVSKGQDDLDELLKGASEAELAAAEQAVASAQSTLDAALAKQATLVQSPTPAQLAAAQAAVTTAQQAVASAQSALDAARAKLAALQASPSDADLAAAQAAVTAANTNVTTAQNLVATAQAGLDSAEAVLRAAGNAYCNSSSPPPRDSVCSPFTVPVSQTGINELLDDLSSNPAPTPTPTPTTTTTTTTLITNLVQANSAYIAAQNTLANAQAGLTSAQAGLTSAQAKLDSLGGIPAPEDTQAAQAAVTAAEEGLNAAQANVRSAQAQLDGLAPSPEDLAAAQSAVDAAQESLQAAQAKYQDIQKGADADAVQAAEDAVSSAEAGLNSAMAKRDKLVEGADPDDVDLQVQQVHLAEITVSEAQRAVDEATLKAPYDGSVSSVDIQVGDFVSSQLPAITLLTPGALKVSLSVGETDLPSLRVGMVGVMIFDALQTHAFPVVITRMGLGPKVEQGVVTYAVEGALGGLGQGPADRPAPGMNGSAILVTEQHQDVLVVPNRAIRRRGDQVVVDIMVDGKVETRTIQTGLSDTDNTEVVSGLAEGDLLALPSTTAAGQQKTPEALPGGIS
jgi:HlyD family secretion protein